MRARAETGGLQGTDASRADGSDQLFERVLITEAMARLHPSHRKVIHRAYYLGWATHQIAADLNVTEPVVKCQLHHALRAFRSSLSELKRAS
ncbi:sigma factor-like helix-turn-helix DNA-binding protein [Mycobacterium sp. 050134]|uniref:sigma factor-like helix-turn-helix DNA-binding protein n=1 Tax=Mycobacterium sp. 050134 TaxID=3096111 RepID=UPI002EDB58F8